MDNKLSLFLGTLQVQRRAAWPRVILSMTWNYKMATTALTNSQSSTGQLFRWQNQPPNLDLPWRRRMTADEWMRTPTRWSMPQSTLTRPAVTLRRKSAKSSPNCCLSQRTTTLSVTKKMCQIQRMKTPQNQRQLRRCHRRRTETWMRGKAVELTTKFLKKWRINLYYEGNASLICWDDLKLTSLHFYLLRFDVIHGHGYFYIYSIL